MRKAILSVILAFVFMTALCAPALSENQPAGTELYIKHSDGSAEIVYSDGTKLVLSAPYSDSPSPKNVTSTTFTSRRDATIENSDGTVACKFTLTARFTYEYGVSSACIGTSHTYNVYDDKWSYKSGSSSYSGNTATGAATFTKKLFLFITQDHVVNISLTCDKYGNVI